MRIIAPPKPGDYPPYAQMYMKLIPTDGMVLKYLQNNFYRVKDLIYSLPLNHLLYRYAPGKWSINETLVHIVDNERIFAYRALCYARNEHQNLPIYDLVSYVKHAGADKRSLDNIFEEYEAVRQSTIALYNGLPDEYLDHTGHSADPVNDTTARALAYQIAGHEMHHYFLIKDKYLKI